jgi:hypothetical protein
MKCPRPRIGPDEFRWLLVSRSIAAWCKVITPIRIVIGETGGCLILIDRCDRKRFGTSGWMRNRGEAAVASGRNNTAFITLFTHGPVEHV